MPEPADGPAEKYGSHCGRSTPPGMRETTATALPRRISGYRYPDVSGYRPIADWGALAAAYPVACCKTSEGLRTDPTWRAFLAGCRRRGILPIGYHFLRAEWSAEEQAAHFLRQLDGGPCGVMVDVETSLVRTNPTIGLADRWVRTVEAALHRPRSQVLCYLPRWWWLAHGAGAAALAGTLAVNSDYRASPDLTPYAGFRKIAVIQYSDRHPIAGVREPGDMNVALGMGVGGFAEAIGCPFPARQEGEDVVIDDQDRAAIASAVLEQLRAQVFDVQPPIRQGNAGHVIGATYNKVGDVQSRLSDVATRIDFLYDQLGKFAPAAGVTLDVPPWRPPAVGSAP